MRNSILIMVAMSTAYNAHARDPFSFHEPLVAEQVIIQSVEVCQPEDEKIEVIKDAKPNEWQIVEQFPGGTIIKNSDGQIRKIILPK